MKIMDEDKVIIKSILKNQVDRERLKKALYLIINEELKNSDDKIDVQLIKECVDTLSILDNIEEPDINVESRVASVKKAVEERNAKKKGRVMSLIGLKKIIVVACILIAAFFSVNFVFAKAFNISIGDKVVEYGRNFIRFNFSSKGEGDTGEFKDNVTIDNLKEEFALYGIMPALPSYLPDFMNKAGFEHKSADNGINTYTVSFKGKGKTLIMLLIEYRDGMSAPDIKNPDANIIAKLEVDEIDVYITNQGSSYCAVFNKDAIIYNISSNLNYIDFVNVILSFGGSKQLD